MKQVAGTLRLELAQYRELAAFSQFGSDLDTATKRQLNRGARLVELLKQGQYVPIPVEMQIFQVTIATSGGVDDIPTEQVTKFFDELRVFAESKHADLLRDIKEQGKLDDNLRKKITAVVNEFKLTFTT